MLMSDGSVRSAVPEERGGKPSDKRDQHRRQGQGEDDA